MRTRLWIVIAVGCLLILNAFSSGVHAAPSQQGTLSATTQSTTAATALSTLSATQTAQATSAATTTAPAYLGIRTTVSAQGTQVIEVVPGSPADAAGFKIGDLMLSVNGESLSASVPLGTLIGRLAPNATVTIVVSRGDSQITLKVTLGERPTQPDIPVPAVPPGSAFLGVGLIDSGDGIRIARVAEGSAAEKAGLHVNDLIQNVDGQKIVSVGQVQAALSAKGPGQTLQIIVQRDGQSLTFTVTLEGRRAAGDPNLSGNVLFQQIGFTAALGTDGLRVIDIVANSPADRAGLKRDDRIESVDGQRVTAETIGDVLRKLSGATTTSLGVVRGSQQLTISITTPQPDETQPYAPGAPRVRLGVAYEVVTASLATAKNLTVKDGALIVEIQPNSPAEQAGLKVGDVVTEVDGDKVDAKRTLAVRMIAYGPGDTLTLTVVRGSETLKIVVTLAARGVA